MPDTTQKATDIFDWLDGTRTIAGDTSTGSNIYYYTLAPRANTLAIESTGSPYWWQDPGGISVTGPASWDQHLENGGFIFYTAFYDILARAAYKGIDNAYARMKTIAGEFAVDELRRDPTNSYGAAWRIGVTGEFPESGLVPAAFLYTVAGIDASKDGLTIAPEDADRHDDRDSQHAQLQSQRLHDPSVGRPRRDHDAEQRHTNRNVSDRQSHGKHDLQHR